MSQRPSRLLRELIRFGIKKSTLLRLFLFTILFALFEGLGIGMLLPILQYVQNAQTEFDQGLWGHVSRLVRAAGVPHGRYEILVLLSMAFVALLVRSALHYVRDIDASRLKFALSSAVRQRAAEAFVRADMTFLSTHDSGELFSALTWESDRAAEALASRVVFLTAVALSLIYLFLLFMISFPLALCTVPVCVLVAYLLRRQGGSIQNLSAEVSGRNTVFGARIHDRLQGITRIKMRGQEENTLGELRATISSIASSLFRIEKQRILMEIGIFPLLVIASFLLLFTAVEFLSIDLASIGIFMFVVVRLSPQATLMNSMWSHMHGCVASFDNLNQLIDAATQHRERLEGTIPFKGLEKAITLTQVGFRYPGSKRTRFAIRDISINIPRGSLTAIVGRSGAGKTTLVRLLIGFLLPQEGVIRIDSIPLNDFDQRSLRQHISLVPQEPYLFNESIGENLSYGVHPPPKTAQLQEMLNQTCSLEFVQRLENGLDTVVGERGAFLSQGERQRLTITHALAASPEILILDEPTSALDAESEDAIRRLFTHWRGRLTIIVIAHRFSTIRDADQILLLDNGSLVGEGNHDKLLLTSSLYRSLFETQMAE